MTVTLTASYKEILKPETVEFIDGLVDEGYEIVDILEFIDEHSEEDFVTYYEAYVEQGENLGYDVVDAFVKENGFCDVEHCEDAFVGSYRSGADFAEEFYNEQYNLPCEIVVDWEQTWDSSLYYDFTFVEGEGMRDGYVFRQHY